MTPNLDSVWARDGRARQRSARSTPDARARRGRDDAPRGGGDVARDAPRRLAALSDAWPGYAGDGAYRNASRRCVWHEGHWWRAARGRYVCFDTPAEAAAYASPRAYVYSPTGDDDDAAFVVPFEINCDAFDDDAVYSEASCAGFDTPVCKADFADERFADPWSGNATYATGSCCEGTDCYEWCGAACRDGWWSYCLWELVATRPRRARRVRPCRRPRAARCARPAARRARSSFCGACGGGNAYCDAVWHYYNAHNSTGDGHNQFLNIFTMPEVLSAWCEHWGLPYRELNATRPDTGRRGLRKGRCVL